MRKYHVVLFFLLCIFTTAVQARFFVGIEGGYLGSATYQDLSKDGTLFVVAKPSIIPSAFSDSLKGFNTSLSIGTESFFGDYFGIRLDFLAGYNQMTQHFDSIKAQFNLINTSLYFDFLVNFLKSSHVDLGFIGGIGMDVYYRLNYLKEINIDDFDMLPMSDFLSNFIQAYSLYTNSALTSRVLMNFAGRVGFTALIANHHRLEFVAKLPIASISSFPLIGGNMNLANVTFNVGYRFIF
ncbi:MULTISPECIES: outer membrane beta-barrel protein [unclassified Helicobacter]|uniref:outer membrane beta-barrel protein n=1 Tax=unclassified Helicobacter TaxID=2593540 RepID=UPI000CF04F3C|nr:MULTISPECIES: outer membrane beta-barrel protein [unclassified Helicobacter]